MIKGINIAAQGMLQAEKRATDIAKGILELNAKEASFSLEDQDKAQGSPSDTAQPQTGTPIGPGTTSEGFGGLIQHFADLRAEENAFKANAAVFKRLDETQDEALGSILDDEG